MGGCSIDAHGTALTDEVLAACQAADAVLLGAVGGPKWDTTDPDAPRPSRACSACARAWGSTPTCARCGPTRRWSTPARCARTDRRHRPAGRARADRRHLLRRQRPRRRRRPRHLRVPARGDRAHRRTAFEAARRRAEGRAASRGHLGRQGQRAGDLAPVARGRRPRRRRVRRRRARPPAGRQRRDAAGLAPGRAST